MSNNKSDFQKWKDGEENKKDLVLFLRRLMLGFGLLIIVIYIILYFKES